MSDVRRPLGRLPEQAFGCLDLPAIAAATLAGYRSLPDLTGMVSDAMDMAGANGVVSAMLLTPSLPAQRIVGPALTVLNRPRGDDPARAAQVRDNRLADIEAHNLARPGDVVVVQGVVGISSMGGIAASIAKRQGEAAIIIDGSVRDIEASRRLSLPMWTRGVTPLTGKWRIETVAVNVPIEICGVPVRPGDLVVADDNGVCFVPQEAMDRVLTIALSIADDENRRQALIATGAPIHELVPRKASRGGTGQPQH